MTIIDKIKESYDIVDLFKDQVELSSRGNRLIGLCPFHAERTPSFHIRKKEQHFKCFGCSASGDVIDAYALLTGVTNNEAIKQMAANRGLEITPELRPPKRPRVLNAASGGRDRAPVETLTRIIPQELMQWWAVERGWRPQVLHMLIREGSLGWDGKQINFHYPHGTKARRELRNSGSAWWKSSIGDQEPWRARWLDAYPQVENVHIFEGETDLISMLSDRPESISDLYIAAPSASWAPNELQAWRIAEHRKVMIYGDNDDAGRAFNKRIEDAIGKACQHSFTAFLGWGEYPDAPKGADIDWVLKNAK